MNDSLKPRWHAAINFRTEHGQETVEHNFAEFSDLEEIVEHGPDWNCIVDIRIVLADPSDPGKTLEQDQQDGAGH